MCHRTGKWSIRGPRNIPGRCVLVILVLKCERRAFMSLRPSGATRPDSVSKNSKNQILKLSSMVAYIFNPRAEEQMQTEYYEFKPSVR